MMFNHQKEGKQATPNDSLEEQIVSSTFPKSEREWWAHHEINRLRAEVASLQDRLDARIEQLHESESYGFRLTQQLADAKEYAERLRQIIKNVSDGNYPHATRKEKCAHGKYHWEDCEVCVDEYLATALALPKPWDAIRKSEG